METFMLRHDRNKEGCFYAAASERIDYVRTKRPYLRGAIITEYYFDDDTLLHRTDGPAHVEVTPDWREETYYVHGKLHRANGPAIIRSNVHNNVVVWEEWYINGEHPSVHLTCAVRRDRNTGVVTGEFWEVGGKLVNKLPQLPDKGSASKPLTCSL